MKDHAHFKGKSAFEHLKEARVKGLLATEEIHGTEIPGHMGALIDAAKDTAFVLLLLWTLFQELNLDIPLFSFIFLLGYLFWKTGRSAILGYTRLERLHKLIEQERYEIEHNREQEKEELIELYQAKGFSGKLLEEAVEVLMADDNRLLQVMLEEELGLNLESFEHPLKQAAGAFFGTLLSAALMGISFFLLPNLGHIIAALLLISIASGSFAKRLKNPILPSVVWNLSVATVSTLVAYFMLKIVL